MTFQEALALLKAGEYVCREAWKLEEGYLAFLDGMKHIWKIMLHPNPNAGNYIFSVEDLESQDWEKFDFDKKSSSSEVSA
jgi:hypothetical protein